jgi:hypothetical protein
VLLLSSVMSLILQRLLCHRHNTTVRIKLFHPMLLGGPDHARSLHYSSASGVFNELSHDSEFVSMPMIIPTRQAALCAHQRPRWELAPGTKKNGGSSMCGEFDAEPVISRSPDGPLTHRS